MVSSDRRTFIGGSDAPVILGVSPYKSPVQLWLEKTGQTEPEDISGEERVHWGTILESPVAEEFARRTGLKIRKVNQRIQSKERLWQVAQIDRRIVGGGILEVKTSGKADDWDAGVPVYVEAQVTHQLAVTGLGEAYVAVLLNGRDFRIYHLKRNSSLIQNLIDIEADFWDHVQRMIPPEPKTIEDVRCLWPNASSAEVVGGDVERAILRELLEVQEMLKQYKEREDALKAKLGERLADLGDTLVIDGKPVLSYKYQERRIVSTDALREKYPQIAQELETVSSTRVMRVLKGAKEVV